MKIFNLDIQMREGVGSKSRKEAAAEPSVAGGSFEAKIEHASGFNTSPTVSAWYRGVELRANAMAQLRLEFQQRDKKGGNFVQYERGPVAKKLNYLLQVRPNDYENASQMARRKEILRIMKGNAYIYIERDIDDEIKAIHLCSNGSYNQSNDTYNIVYTPKGICKTVSSCDIIHLRNTFTSEDGMTGISTLSYASRALNINATNDKQALEIAGKGGRLKLLLTQAKEKFQAIGGKLSQDQMEKRKNELQEDLLKGDVGVIPYGTDVKEYSMNAADMQILESRKFGVAEIGRFLGLNPQLLGDITNSNYKTAEFITLELYRTLAPLIHEEEMEWNSKVLGAELYGVQRFHLCEKPLFRLDLAAQAQWNKNRLETGVATINELRAENDMPTVSNGDKVLVSANLKTIEMLMKEGQTTTISGEEGGAA